MKEHKYISKKYGKILHIFDFVYRQNYYYINACGKDDYSKIVKKQLKIDYKFNKDEKNGKGPGTMRQKPRLSKSYGEGMEDGGGHWCNDQGGARVTVGSVSFKPWKPPVISIDPQKALILKANITGSIYLSIILSLYL